MRKQFVSTITDFPRTLTRREANGIKKVIIEDNVEMPCCISMDTTEDGTLVIKNDGDCPENEEAAYTILCKEIGLVGASKKYYSDISVIFCDEGWMLVTLKKGALAIMMNGELAMPVVGDISGLGSVSESSVLHVDAQTLMGYVKYSKDKSKFPWEFEFVLSVTGEIIGDFKNLRVRLNSTEDIDISMGYYALYLQREQAKKNTKVAKKFMNQFTSGNTDVDEWDEDEETTEEDSDEEYDDEWE